MTKQFAAVFLAFAWHAQAGTSTHYSLTPDTNDKGGLRTGSTHYTADFSMAPGGAGDSPAYRARTGYAGQLNDAIGISVHAMPLTLDETAARQLGADLLLDDSTRTVLDPGSIAWSVQSGPLASISAGGLATAAVVYEDTTALARATYRAFTGTLSLTVVNTLLDNSGSYAGDGVDDAWQVRYFGLINPGNAGTADDADSDGQTNLIEYAFGTNPISNSSGPSALQIGGTFSAATITAPGLPIVAFESITNGIDFRALFIRRKNHLAAGLVYSPQFSANLTVWQTSSTPPSVLADNGTYQVVSVPYTPLVGGKKARFFRISVNVTP